MTCPGAPPRRKRGRGGKVTGGRARSASSSAPRLAVGRPVGGPHLRPVAGTGGGGPAPV